jgi:hypothetical protein
MELPQGVALPACWTNAETDEQWLLETFPHTSYNLRDVLLVTENLRCGCAIVASAGSCYLWHQISDDVCRIDAPTDIVELLQRLGHGDDYEWPLQLTALTPLDGHRERPA